MVMGYYGISIHCTIQEMGITQQRYVCWSLLCVDCTMYNSQDLA